LRQNFRLSEKKLYRSSFAFFVALLMHLLLLLIFWILGILLPVIEKPVTPQEKKIKISLKEMPVKKKEAPEPVAPVEEVKQTPIAPPMPKGSQLKEIIKEEPLKYEPKPEPKKPKLNPKHEKPIQEKKPQPKIEPLPSQKPFIPLKEEKKEVKKEVDPLAWMSEDKSADEDKKPKAKVDSGSSINSNIKELYGDEFGKLTPGQQKYIIDNQEIMRRITQEVLTRVASVNLPRDLNVNKVNVIEFYLHPNGDMTGFKFLQKSDYFVLDDTTKETIEYAYSKYPRPTEVILIRYNVFYNLASH
jgi:outer membrane biosynthesis protein TonB